MGKTIKDSDKAKAKKLRRITGQVERHYGKAGPHEDKKPQREDRNICRKKVNVDDEYDDSDMEWFFDEEADIEE